MYRIALFAAFIALTSTGQALAQTPESPFGPGKVEASIIPEVEASSSRKGRTRRDRASATTTSVAASR